MIDDINYMVVLVFIEETIDPLESGLSAANAWNVKALPRTSLMLQIPIQANLVPEIVLMNALVD